MGRRTLELLDEFETLCVAHSDEVVSHQRERLRLIIEHAYRNVPYYQQSFDAAGIDSAVIETIDDLQSVPLLEKKNVREAQHRFIARGYEKRVSEVRTGGSTGAPMKYFLGSEGQAANQAAVWRARRWWGIDIGQPAVHFWGHSTSFAPGLKGKFARAMRPIKDRVFNRRTLSAYNMSMSSVFRYWQIIEEFGPCYLLGYASTLYLFARFLKELGIDGRGISLDLIISTSEVLYPWQRHILEESFGCAVVNEYGATEVGMIAYECPEGNLHLMDDTVLIEVVKSDSAGADDLGEVVVTQLYNLGAPLIRYRLGDVAQSIRQGCSCGLGLRVLCGFQGRTHDLIVAPDGRYVHGEFFTHLFDQLENVHQFQVVQKAPDSLLIRVVLNDPSLQINEPLLLDNIYSKMGDICVVVQYVDVIEQEASGKYKWIVSEIKPGIL